MSQQQLNEQLPLGSGKYQPYGEYKDSGVEWLGEVPDEWSVTQVKYGFDITLGKMLQTSQKTDGDELKPYLRAANIQTSGVDLKDVRSMWFSSSDRKSLLLRSGDLLISEGGDVGRSAIWNGELSECYIQNAINRARAKNGNCESFLHYWVSSVKAAGYVDIICNKATIAHYTAEKVETTPLLLPSPKEQRTIAAFLDYETARIDGLIAKQQRLIELLKEKRQAVISHAVTKGLNPDAPMKDSGVEWLGQVPAHWVVTKFGYISNVVRGGSPRPAGDPELFDGDYSPWVTVAEITKDDELYLTETDTFLTKKGSDQCRVFKNGTLLLSNSGATLGVPKLLSIDANANDGVVGFERLTLDHEFAYFYLSTLTEGLREKIKQGSGQPNLNTDIVKAIEVPVPPESEVVKIVSQISVIRKEYADLSQKASDAIILMQERRTALISAAVTGKIDLRGWVQPEES